MVTTEILRNAGYPVGMKDDAQVALGESAIKAAYFSHDEKFDSSEAIQLLYALVYSWMLRMRLTATRYGSVQKVSQYSINADNLLIQQEIRMRCMLPLEKYHAESGFAFSDVLEIYDNVQIL